MPHALTTRQREFLDFIREFVARNESSPRLEEIAGHFEIKLPTANKILEALQRKGYLYFDRTGVAGYFIRLIERAGAPEVVMEVHLVGKVTGWGEVIDFPEMLGSFPAIIPGGKPDEVFALAMIDNLPQADIWESDFIIFDRGKRPQPGDICIAPIGERFFLVRIPSLTFDEQTDSLLMAQEYPVPEALTHPEFGQKLNWVPLAYDEENQAIFTQIAEEQRWPLQAIPPDWIVATALRLQRILSPNF